MAGGYEDLRARVDAGTICILRNFQETYCNLMGLSVSENPYTFGDWLHDGLDWLVNKTDESFDWVALNLGTFWTPEQLKDVQENKASNIMSFLLKQSDIDALEELRPVLSVPFELKDGYYITMGKTIGLVLRAYVAYSDTKWFTHPECEQV